MFDPSHNAYQLIKAWYGRKRASRSSRLYIEHIREGCFLLSHLYQASAVTRAAFCLHPLVQADDDYYSNIDALIIWAMNNSDHDAALNLALEYRVYANGYRSVDPLRDASDIQIPDKDDPVYQMLVADKIQNEKDACLYLASIDPDDFDNRLDPYFESWMKALGIGTFHTSNFKSLLRETFPLRHDLETSWDVKHYYQARLATELDYDFFTGNLSKARFPIHPIYTMDLDSKYQERIEVGIQANIRPISGSGRFKSLYLYPRWRGLGLYRNWAELNDVSIITSPDCALQSALNRMGLKYELLDG